MCNKVIDMYNVQKPLQKAFWFYFHTLINEPSLDFPKYEK